MPEKNKEPLNSMRREGQYLSPKDLEKEAENIAQCQPESIKNLIYLYCLARRYVSYYEADFSMMPTQVLNEYRNSLDHIMRCLASRADGNLASDDDNGNLRKATAHMQRAVLDVCKHFVLGIQGRIEKFKESYSDEILILVSDGSFYREFMEREKEATELYKVAKFSDLALGEKKEANDEILRGYVDSVAAFYKLWSMREDKREAIAQAKRQYDNIHKGGQVLSGKLQAFIALIIAAIFLGLGKFL